LPLHSQHVTPHEFVQLQTQAAQQSSAKADEALAAASEAHDAAVRRLKADLQRKSTLLTTAKADAEKQLAAAQSAKQALDKAKAEAAARHAEPLQAARAEVATKQALVSTLTNCIRALAASALGAAAGMHAGAPCQPAMIARILPAVPFFVTLLVQALQLP
jgi:hypothetical protein